MRARRIVIAAALVAGVGALVLPLAGMSWIETLGFKSQEQIVRQRIEGYWNARVSGDLEAMAPYVHPLQEAIQENSVLVTDKYEIIGLELKEDEAFAKVQATYSFKDPQMAHLSKLAREVTLEDHWVLYKGTWYHGLHPVGLGQMLRQAMGKWKPPVESNP